MNTEDVEGRRAADDEQFRSLVGSLVAWGSILVVLGYIAYGSVNSGLVETSFLFPYFDAKELAAACGTNPAGCMGDVGNRRIRVAGAVASKDLFPLKESSRKRIVEGNLQLSLVLYGHTSSSFFLCRGALHRASWPNRQAVEWPQGFVRVSGFLEDPIRGERLRPLLAQFRLNVLSRGANTSKPSAEVWPQPLISRSGTTLIVLDDCIVDKHVPIRDEFEGLAVEDSKQIQSGTQAGGREISRHVEDSKQTPDEGGTQSRGQEMARQWFQRDRLRMIDDALMAKTAEERLRLYEEVGTRDAIFSLALKQLGGTPPLKSLAGKNNRDGEEVLTRKLAIEDLSNKVRESLKKRMADGKDD